MQKGGAARVGWRVAITHRPSVLEGGGISRTSSLDVLIHRRMAALAWRRLSNSIRGSRWSTRMMTETQQNQRKGARVPSRKGFRLLGASTRPVSHFQLPGAVDAARVLGASRVPWTWLGQDLFADFVAQIIQQLLRAQAASFRLEPSPVQQRPELGKGHALGAECQRGATGAVGVGQGAQLPQGGPIAQLHIIGNGRSDRLGRKSTRLNSSHLGISYAV